MKILRWILFLIVLTGCQEDKEFDFPMIHTGEVTHIDSTGATFSARIVDISKDNITAFGFVWGTEEVPDINSSRYMIQSPTEPKIYTARIFYDLYPNRVYSVRAFAMNERYICYGLSVRFLSKGCSGSVAHHSHPLSAEQGTMGSWSATLPNDRFNAGVGITSGSWHNQNPTLVFGESYSEPDQLITLNLVP